MELSMNSFFVTVGRGTENFAESEIRNTFSTQEDGGSLLAGVQMHDGKILFKISDTTTESILEKILALQCVERAFVTITQFVNDAEGKRDFLNKLMGKMSTIGIYDAVKKVLEQLSSVLRKRKIMNEISHKTSCNDEPHRKVARIEVTSGGLSPCPQTSINCAETNKEAKFDNRSEVKIHGDVFKTFRMSVKRCGKSVKWIDVKRLSKDISWRVSKASNWTVDLRNQDFEICLHINDHHVFAGIPLTRKPLSRRPFILDPGLRSPVAWIMVQLASIKTGDVILDPMCGKGTLLLEACSCVKDVWFIGADVDATQMRVACQNIERGGFERHIDILQADCLCIPLKPMSVHGIVCDAPFYQNHFTSKTADEFYALFLQEMYRVLQENGRFVLLTSQSFSEMIMPWLQTNEQVTEKPSCLSLQTSPEKSDPDTVKNEEHSFSRGFQISPFLFKFVSKHYMKLGETHAEVIVMTKL